MRGAEELGQAWRMSSLGDFFPLGTDGYKMDGILYMWVRFCK